MAQPQTTSGQTLADVYNAAGKAWGVAPSLLYAVGNVESRNSLNPVTSPAGAQGTQQFMPATAQAMGMTNAQDPTQSIYASAKYLSQLIKQYGDPEKALMAYNAGSDQSKWNPGYVQKVSAAQQKLLAATQKDASSMATQGPQYVSGDQDLYKMVGGNAPQASGPQAASPQAPAVAGPRYINNDQDLYKLAGPTPDNPSAAEPEIDAASGGMTSPGVIDQLGQEAAGMGKSVVGLGQTAVGLLGDVMVNAGKLSDRLEAKLNMTPSNHTAQAQQFVNQAQSYLAGPANWLSNHGANSSAGLLGQGIADADIGVGAGMWPEMVIGKGLAAAAPYIPRAAAIGRNLLTDAGQGLANLGARGAVQGAANTAAFSGPNGVTPGQLAGGAALGTMLNPAFHVGASAMGTVLAPAAKYITSRLSQAPGEMEQAARTILGTLRDNGVSVNDLDKQVSSLGPHATLVDHPALTPTAVALSKVQGAPHDLITTPVLQRMGDLHTTEVPFMVRNALGVPDTDQTDLLKLEAQTEYLNHGNSGVTGGVQGPGLYEKAKQQVVPTPSFLQGHVDRGDRFGLIQQLQDIAKTAQENDINNGVVRPNEYYDVFKGPESTELKDQVPMGWLMNLKNYVKNAGDKAYNVTGDQNLGEALVGNKNSRSGGIISTLNNYMRDVSPEFAQANDNDTKYYKAETAFNQGLKHQTMSPEEINNYMNGVKINGKIVTPGLDQEGKKWFLAGAAQKLTTDMQKAALRPGPNGNLVPSSNSVTRAFGNMTKQASTQALFRNHAQGQALLNKLGNAAQIMENSRQLIPTSTQIAEAGPNLVHHIIPTVAEVATGGGPMAVVRGLGRFFGAHAAHMSPEVKSDIAALLSGPPKASVELLRKYESNGPSVVQRALQAGKSYGAGPLVPATNNVFYGTPQNQNQP